MSSSRRLIGLCWLLLFLAACGHHKSEPASIPGPPADGWIKHESVTVGIWTPPRFRGGAPNDLDAAVRLAREAGLPDEAAALDAARRRPGVVLFLFDDGETGTSATIEVTSEPASAGSKLDALADAAIRRLPESQRIVQRDAIRIGSTPAIRIVETTDRGETILLFVLRLGKNGIIAAFATPSEQLQTALPDFEKSAASIYSPR